MRTMLILTAAIFLGTHAAPVQAQPQPPTPGPEHKKLKEREGTWETTMKVGDMEFKGTVVYKMELNDLWLVGSLKTDLGFAAFEGKSLETYDPAKKHYTSVWCDSMGSEPMLMTGTYDAAKKLVSMTGKGPDMNGKIATWRSLVEVNDADTFTMQMYVGDANAPMFTTTYRRKK